MIEDEDKQNYCLNGVRGKNGENCCFCTIECTSQDKQPSPFCQAALILKLSIIHNFQLSKSTSGNLPRQSVSLSLAPGILLCFQIRSRSHRVFPTWWKQWKDQLHAETCLVQGWWGSVYNWTLCPHWRKMWTPRPQLQPPKNDQIANQKISSLHGCTIILTIRSR